MRSHQFGGFYTQVGGIGWKIFSVGLECHAVRRQTKANLVIHINTMENRFEVMIPVWTFAEKVEAEIDLGVGANSHAVSGTGVANSIRQ